MSVYLALIMLVAGHVDVDHRVAATVAQMESDWDAGAVGASGEIGLMQIMPLEGRPDAVMLALPHINVQVGCSILRANLRYFGGDWRRALCAYNMGIRGLERRTLDDPAAVQYLERFAEEWAKLWPDDELPWEVTE